MIDWEPKVGDICWFISRYHEEIEYHIPVRIIQISENAGNDRVWGPFSYHVAVLKEHDSTKRNRLKPPIEMRTRKSDLMKMPKSYQDIVVLSS